jgi:hypothetical protein
MDGHQLVSPGFGKTIWGNQRYKKQADKRDVVNGVLDVI